MRKQNFLTPILRVSVANIHELDSHFSSLGCKPTDKFVEQLLVDSDNSRQLQKSGGKQMPFPFSKNQEDLGEVQNSQFHVYKQHLVNRPISLVTTDSDGSELQIGRNQELFQNVIRNK